MGEWSLARNTALHGLTKGAGWRARIGRAGQLALHLWQSVDGEVHRDIINATNALGRLASGHMLKDDVIELVHEHAKFVLIF